MEKDNVTFWVEFLDELLGPDSPSWAKLLIANDMAKREDTIRQLQAELRSLKGARD